MYELLARNPRNVRLFSKASQYLGSLQVRAVIHLENTAFWAEHAFLVSAVLFLLGNCYSTLIMMQSAWVAAPKGKGEPYACTFPTCSRRFVNQAELSNHIEVLHTGDDLEVGTSLDIPDVEELYDVEGVQDFEKINEATITQMEATEGDQTIKAVPRPPITQPEVMERDQIIRAGPGPPITQETLRLHDASINNELARSMTDLSISQIHASTPSEMSDETTYSVQDAEDFPLSEVAGNDSPSVDLPVAMLLYLWHGFLIAVRNQSEAGVRQRTAYRDDVSHHSSISDAGYPAPEASVPSSAASGVKRKYPGDEDDRYDPKNDEKRPKPSNHEVDDSAPLACPFNKHDSIKYGVNGNKAYHVCTTWSDQKTAYFKQHLIRTHCMPEWHCVRCGLDCRNQKDLREHNRQDPPCEVKELDSDKIEPEMQAELMLRSRNTSKTDRITYWYKVYDTIFGQEDRLRRDIDPFYTGPWSEDLNAFIRFSKARLPDIINKSRVVLQENTSSSSDRDRELGSIILQEASNAYKEEMRNARGAASRAARQAQTAKSSSENLANETSNLNLQTSRMERQVSSQDMLSEPLWPTGFHSTRGVPGFPLQSGASYVDPTTGSAQQDSAGPQSALRYQTPLTAFSDLSFPTQDWESGLSIGQHFSDALEDPDLYGANTIPSDFSGYHIVQNPSQHQDQGS